jgi:uncharacterized membrane protein YsdA (DUF1294 family)
MSETMILVLIAVSGAIGAAIAGQRAHHWRCRLRRHLTR